MLASRVFSLIRIGLLALAVGGLAGCGGSGSDGANGTNGTNGTNGSNGSNGTNGINGIIPASSMSAAQWMALKPKISASDIKIDMNGGKPIITFKVSDSVTGLPVIGLGGQYQANMTTTTPTPASAALVPTTYNISFTVAKLVPGVACTQISASGGTPAGCGGPSKWVNYLVSNPGTAAPAGFPAALAYLGVGNYPSADSAGAIVDNGDGTYKYTFYRNLNDMAAFVAALTDDATHLKADLGDVSYQPTLTHRLGIIISGSQPGTGSNTPDHSTSSVAAVPLVYTFNTAYDFIPATGKTVVAGTDTTRNIVMKDACGDCHNGKGIGHASTNALAPGMTIGRNDPVLCVTCHTDQTKYGFVNGSGTTNAAGYTTYYTQNTTEGGNAVRGSAFDFPRMIHQTHMGADLPVGTLNLNNHCNTTTGANLAQCLNKVGYPQEITNCAQCHGGTKSSNVAARKTTDGDNWLNVPSRKACGACHNGIDFGTGLGTTVAGASTGHAGGAYQDDSACSFCHSGDTNGLKPIAVVHRSVTPQTLNPTTQAGVKNVAYVVSSATVTAGIPSINFSIKINGSNVTSLTAPTLANGGLVKDTWTGKTAVHSSYDPFTGKVATSANNTSSATSLVGGPSFYVAFAVPQDGIATPSDFNATASAPLINLLVAAGTSPSAGTIVCAAGGATTLAACPAGVYTATLTGDTVGQPLPADWNAATGALVSSKPNATTKLYTTTYYGSTLYGGATQATETNPVSHAGLGYLINPSPIKLPTTATMVTAAMIGGFTQTNLTDAAQQAYYPYTTAVYNTAAGLGHPTTSTYTTAGTSPNAAAGASGGLVINTPTPVLVATGYTGRRTLVSGATCNTCHSQLGTSPSFHSGARNDPTTCAFCHTPNRNSNPWVIDSTAYVHALHGTSKRSNAFTWQSSMGTNILYPGVLMNCVDCHVSGAFDYSTAATATVLRNRLPRTAVTGSFSVNQFVTTGGVANPAPTTDANVVVNLIADATIQQASPLFNYGQSGAGTSVIAGAGDYRNYGNAFSFTPLGAVVPGVVSSGTGTVAPAHIAVLAGGEILNADNATLMNSPTAAACFSCHDSDAATAHMRSNGGSILATRAAVKAANGSLISNEACLTCHGKGTGTYDINVVHHN